MIDKREITEGVTEHSKEQFQLYRYDIGEIKSVEIDWSVEHIEYTTVITGELDRIVLSGFSIGYLGEGPEGLMWLLGECGIPYNRDEIVNEVEETGKKRWNKIGTKERG